MSTIVKPVASPVQIDSRAFSAVSSVSSSAFLSGAYRRLELHLRVDSGTVGNATMTLAGLGGVYKSYNHFMLGTLGVSNSATTWVLLNCGPTSQFDINFQINQGGLRSYGGLGKDTTAEYAIVTTGTNSDSASGITGLTITFAGVSAGWFELIGYP